MFPVAGAATAGRARRDRHGHAARPTDRRTRTCRSGTRGYRRAIARRHPGVPQAELAARRARSLGGARDGAPYAGCRAVGRRRSSADAPRDRGPLRGNRAGGGGGIRRLALGGPAPGSRRRAPRGRLPMTIPPAYRPTSRAARRRRFRSVFRHGCRAPRSPRRLRHPVRCRRHARLPAAPSRAPRPERHPVSAPGRNQRRRRLGPPHPNRAPPPARHRIRVRRRGPFPRPRRPPRE